MNTVTNEQVKDEKPVKTRDLNAQGTTYEQCIAFYIVGKLVLDGALDPQNFNFDHTPEGVPYIVESITEAVGAGLAAYGWEHGISQLINAAQVGEMHGWTPRAEQGGAE